MYRWPVKLACLAAAALSAAVAVAQFKVDVRLVHIVATVKDRTGKLQGGLQKEVEYLNAAVKRECWIRCWMLAFECGVRCLKCYPLVMYRVFILAELLIWAAMEFDSVELLDS